jgi:molybdopterin-guanine dinucleotide biosynthesis protein A
MTGSRVSAVILAGGRSERFGRDKLAEPIDGRPMLQHVIEAVRAHASEIVVVVPPGAAPALPADVRVAHDAIADEGPLVGVAAGLRASHEPVVLVVGGDMPSIAGAVITLLLGRMGDPHTAAAVLEHDGRPRPLPLVVRRDPALAMADASVETGERRLRALVEGRRADVIPEADWRRVDPDAWTVRDIDTPADLP